MSHIALTIPDFDLRLAYPEDWDHEVEENGTYLFWDEDSGSLRLTPMRMEQPGFDLDVFLERRLDEQPTGAWRTLGPHRYVSYCFDGEHDGQTIRNHVFLGGAGNRMLVWTWSYDAALLDDDEWRDAVAAGTEAAEAVIASARLA